MQMLNEPPDGCRIPQEICDIIIDYAHKDPQVLATCGLVCRSWVASSRYHLFRSVELADNNMPGFLDLLESEILICLQYLRAFKVTDYTLIGYSVWDKVLRRCSFLPSVASLIISPKVHDPSRWTKCSTIVNIFPHLTRLTLHDLTFVLPELFECVSSFTHLIHLSLHISVMSDPYRRGNGSEKCLPPAKLSSVDVGVVYFPPKDAPEHAANLGQVYDWLTSGSQPIVIERLRIVQNLTTEKHLEADHKFLRCIGDNMQYLELCHETGPAWRPFDLSHNTELRSIHFCDLFLYTHLPQWMDAVARTLKTLTTGTDASHLQHLKLSLPWGSAHFFLNPQEPNCDHLLRVLGHPLFTNLETLEFSMHAIPGMRTDADSDIAAVDIARQIVERRFASCETRYALRVVVTFNQEEEDVGAT